MIPFFFAMLAGLLLITFWPALSETLPRWWGLM